jgi:hypothetical protein
MCVCVCVYVWILYVLKFSFVGIIVFIFYSVNFQNVILHSVSLTSLTWNEHTFHVSTKLEGSNVRNRKRKLPILHYTTLFSISYFKCTKCARTYLGFLVFSITNSVKVLNNPGMVFIGIWHRSRQSGSPKPSSKPHYNKIIIISCSTINLYVIHYSDSVNQ